MKEKLLAFMKEKAYRPMSLAELAEAFLVDGKDQKKFANILEQMEKAGEIIRTRWDKFGVPERMNLIVGRLQGHAKGFGFVIPDQADQADIYIHANDTNGALHNDRVVARLHTKKSGDRAEGEIIRILERANTTVVGTFQRSKKSFAFVLPDDSRLGQDIFVAADDFSGAVSDEKVVVEITQWPQGRQSAVGRVIQRLGPKDSPGTDILSIIYKHRLPLEFPEAVLNEAAHAPEVIAAKELEGRTDFRTMDIVTIDGEDAKDLDDAVHVQKLDTGNFRLGVHIADVSHYVQPGSYLDKEAQSRGTSVYLVDRVIPMLPERLSNGICSLNPRQDRLTVSLVMEIDTSGKVVDYQLSKGVIRTKERMTYTAVFKILKDKDPDLISRYQELVPMFQLMEELASILTRRRSKRGAIDFDFTETKVEIGEKGKPVAIIPRPRTIAEGIIEEFMLVANETVAEHFTNLAKEFIYRTHDKPKASKIQELNEFVHNFGLHIKGAGDDIHPKSLQQLLKQVEGEPHQRLINTVTLRSMKQAKYTDTNSGHFGLAAKFYTHFTSPIRRYPDLLVHRFITYWLEKDAPKTWRAQVKRLKDLAEHCSRREREAEEAERETVDMKKVEFMEGHLGETFAGIISGVTAFGLFVELENSVEGLVHISNMHDDYYQYNEKLYSLVGERKRKVYRLSDSVRVKLIKVNKDERTMDFLLEETGN